VEFFQQNRVIQVAEWGLIREVKASQRAGAAGQAWTSLQHSGVPFREPSERFSDGAGGRVTCVENSIRAGVIEPSSTLGW
jgi:hypothetical protein